MGTPGRPATPPTRRRTVLGLLALVLSTAAALLVAEGLVREISPQPVWIQPPNLYVDEPMPARYRLRSGVHGVMTDRIEYTIHIVTDEMGLRVPANAVAQPAAGTRILALGDSFTFGVGVEEEQTWIARTGEALRADGYSVATYDAGVPGYGAPDEEALFEHHLADLRPDLVVLGVYLANDLLDASPASLKVEVREGSLVIGGRSANFFDWLNYHSHLFLLVKNAIPWSVQQPLRDALGLGPTATQRQIGTEMGAYARTLPEGARAGLEATDAAYSRLTAAARAAGARLVAVVIPEHIAVDPAFWKARFDFLRLDPAGYEPEGPRRIFRALLEKHSIPYLDLTDAVSAVEAGGTHLYFPYDTHFTPEGHALVARQLEPFLRASAADVLKPALRTAGLEAAGSAAAAHSAL